MRRALTSALSWYSFGLGSVILTSMGRLAELDDRLIEQAAMIFFRQGPSDGFGGNQRRQLGGLVPELLEGLVARGFNLAPQPLPFYLNVLGGFGAHLFLESFSVTACLFHDLG